MAPPALPVVRRGEEPLDDLLERVGREIVDERRDLLRCRGEAGEIEGRTADELAPVGWRQRLEPEFVELGEDEAVDVPVRRARFARLQ